MEISIDLIATLFSYPLRLNRDFDYRISLFRPIIKIFEDVKKYQEIRCQPRHLVFKIKSQKKIWENLNCLFISFALF